jgi:DNA-binding FadR family transcriptional regulator
MSQSRPATAGNWPHVLAHVEEALAKAVAKIQEREYALAASAGNVSSAQLVDFRRFHERRIALEACPKRAQEHLAELEALLRDGEQALRQWLGQAETLRRQLGQKASGGRQ